MIQRLEAGLQAAGANGQQKRNADISKVLGGYGGADGGEAQGQIDAIAKLCIILIEN